jgi:hypothetical protein
MKQEQIKYSEIMKLDFTQEWCHDTVYFDHFGFEYVIIEKQLTKRIYLSWAKETRLCEIVRVDKKGDIKKTYAGSKSRAIKNYNQFF